jgi:hypothetical protein
MDNISKVVDGDGSLYQVDDIDWAGPTLFASTSARVASQEMVIYLVFSFINTKIKIG